MTRQCSSCGGFCKKSGCERENVVAQRTWVGLTNEEIDKTEWGPSYENPMTLAEGLQLFARAIEAKLKEKNT